MTPTICYVANSSWYLYNFRRELILRAISSGYHVIAVTPRDKFTPLLEEMGIDFIEWGLIRTSVNPVSEMLSVIRLYMIYRSTKISITHHFTIKATFYGTLCAKMAHVPIVVNSFTGLGSLFIDQKKRTRLLRRLLMPLMSPVYRSRRGNSVFQNADDLSLLKNMLLCDESRSTIIRGSGVDTNFFKRDKPKYHDGGVFKILFPARLIREKGIEEMVAAHKELKNNGFKIQLLIAGDRTFSNRSSISSDFLRIIENDKSIKLLGFISDMKTLYEEADIVVLPSWREGLSKALIEAAAMELPIVCTDVAGCRDVVRHGISGYLVPAKSVQALRLALEFMIRNYDLSLKYGAKARKDVVKYFQTDRVNSETLDLYKDLISKKFDERRSS